MKIIATIIRNGISRGILEGTKVPEKPELCSWFLSDCLDAKKGLHCTCAIKGKEYNSIIQAIWDASPEFEKQSVIVEDDRFHGIDCFTTDFKLKDGIYPLEGVEADAVWQRKSRRSGVWIDTKLMNMAYHDYRQVLRLIPQPIKKDSEMVYQCKIYVGERKMKMKCRGGVADECDCQLVEFAQPNSEQKKEPTWGSKKIRRCVKYGDQTDSLHCIDGNIGKCGCPELEIVTIIPTDKNKAASQTNRAVEGAEVSEPTNFEKNGIIPDIKLEKWGFGVDEKKEPESHITVVTPRIHYFMSIAETLSKEDKIKLIEHLKKGVSEGEPNQEELFTELITDIQRMEVVDAIDYAKEKFTITRKP